MSAPLDILTRKDGAVTKWRLAVTGQPIVDISRAQLSDMLGQLVPFYRSGEDTDSQLETISGVVVLSRPSAYALGEKLVSVLHFL